MSNVYCPGFFYSGEMYNNGEFMWSCICGILLINRLIIIPITQPLWRTVFEVTVHMNILKISEKEAFENFIPIYSNVKEKLSLKILLYPFNLFYWPPPPHTHTPTPTPS